MQNTFTMNYGICTLSAIPLRKEARHASEMVSQLLYNETYTVLDRTHEWVLIRFENGPSSLLSDDSSAGSGAFAFYQGWIQAKQFCEISEEEYLALKTKKVYLTNKPIVEYKGQLLSLGTPLYEPHPDTVEMPSEFHPELLVEYAKKDILLSMGYNLG